MYVNALLSCSCCGKSGQGWWLGRDSWGRLPVKQPGVLCAALQGWLKLLYTGRCKKYEQGDSMEATLGALENEPPNRQAGAAAAAQQQRPYGQQQHAALGGGLGLHTPAKAGGPAPMLLSPVREEGGGSPRGGGGGAAAQGWGLQDNLDVIACRAEWLYHRCGGGPCCALLRSAAGACCLPLLCGTSPAPGMGCPPFASPLCAPPPPRTDEQASSRPPYP